jgi:hypothetical protein
MTIYTISDTQTQFLELIAQGATVVEATAAVGYSRGIVWHWTNASPEFAARLNATRMLVGKRHANKPTPTTTVMAKAPALSLHQLAMQRLEREVRTDGPNAVLASAAIVLTIPEAIATDTPVDVVETPVASDTFELSTMQKETPTMALHRMMDELFPWNAPCTYQMDTGHVRQHLEQYYNCNLEVELQTSAKSISNTIRYYLTGRFSVAFEPHKSGHAARVYSVPQPKTRA